METNLRPLTLGEILDRTAQLYRTNFSLFAGICAVTNGIVLVLALLFEGVSPAYRAIQTEGKIQAEGWVFLCVVGLLGILLYGASTAAITRAVASVNLGESATIRTAYSSTLPRLGRYLWLMLIAFLIIFGITLAASLAVAIVMALAVFLGAVVFSGSGGSTATARMIGVVMGILFDLGVFAAVVLIATRYALAIPACVVENLKARKSLRRSVELSKGSRGRIFLLFLLVGIVQIGLFLLTQAPFYMYKFRHQLHLPVGLGILSQIVSVATNTLVGPILAAGLTVFYFDQRVRKEGYDIEWMMQAAGLASGGGVAVADSGVVADSGQGVPAWPVAETAPVEVSIAVAPGAPAESTTVPETVADARADGPHD